MKRSYQAKKMMTQTNSPSSSTKFNDNGSSTSSSVLSSSKAVFNPKRLLPNNRNIGVKVEEDDRPNQRKRKLSSSNTAKRKYTSDTDNKIAPNLKANKNSVIIQDTKERVKIKAKRKTPAASAVATSASASSIKAVINDNNNKKNKNINENMVEKKPSLDTPQMKMLKEKMQMRQIKGNAPKKNKILLETEIKKEPLTQPNKNYDNNNKFNKTINNKINLRKNARKKKNLNVKVENQQVLKNDKRSSSATQSVDSKDNLTPAEKLKMALTPKDVKSLKKIPKLKKNAGKDEKRDVDSVCAESLGLTLSSSTTTTSSVVNTPQGNQTKEVRATKTAKSRSITENSTKICDNVDKSGLKNCFELLESPKTPPNIYKNAEERLSALRTRLSDQIRLDKQLSSTLDESNDQKDDFCEEMEWEPIEEEKIIFEMQAVRAELIIEDVDMIEVPYTKTSQLSTTSNSTTIHVVIDTNVFLSSIETIEQIRDATFKTYGKPIIVIPWRVIRELDFIKDDKNNSRSENLKAKARSAVRFINSHFSSQHPRFLGQKRADALANKKKYAIECPDDEILQTCLQIRAKNSTVVLLSFDKNLCNKALISDIPALGKDEPIEKIECLLEKNKKRGRIKSDPDFLKIEPTEDSPNWDSSSQRHLAVDQTANEVDEVYEDTKSLLTAFLTVVVSTELKALYGQDWERFVIIAPPWNAVSVLRCAVKHFIAAVGDSFYRKAQTVLKNMLQLFMTLDTYKTRKVQDVVQIVELFHDLVQCVNDIDKYRSVWQKTVGGIDDIKKRCAELTQRRQKNINGGVGDSVEEEERRADVAFKHFDDIYVFARDFCGTVSEICGIPCAFEYRTLNAQVLSLNEDDIKRIKCDVAGNLNRLLQVLSATLDNVDKLHVDHQFVIAIYQLLVSFLPETVRDAGFNEQLAPKDVYYCIKRREKCLRNGMGQLQVLSSHFSQVALATT